MKWSICIITVLERELELRRIKGILEYQIGDRNDIEVLIYGSSEGIGTKRQWCLEHARGNYINFVDDDDIVAHDYIDTIYPLLDGVDYIGFDLQLYKGGKKQKLTHHSLKNKEWHEDGYGYYRDISHLNPMRRAIASQAIFDGQASEDFRWANKLRGIPKTEYYIDRPMYFYFYSSEHSLTKEVENGNA